MMVEPVSMSLPNSVIVTAVFHHQPCGNPSLYLRNSVIVPPVLCCCPCGTLLLSLRYSSIVPVKLSVTPPLSLPYSVIVPAVLHHFPCGTPSLYADKLFHGIEIIPALHITPLHTTATFLSIESLPLPLQI